MLTSRTEKWLHGEFERQRNAALLDSTGISTDGTYGLDDLGITTEGLGINDPLTYQIPNTPVDPESVAKPHKVDVRYLPGHD